MPKDFKPGCERPEGGPSGEPEENAELTVEKTEIISEAREAGMIKVGKKAPNFTAPAYFKGKFASVELNEYLGKWVLLCFYPGDFTFV